MGIHGGPCCRYLPWACLAAFLKPRQLVLLLAQFNMPISCLFIELPTAQRTLYVGEILRLLQNWDMAPFSDVEGRSWFGYVHCASSYDSCLGRAAVATASLGRRLALLPLGRMLPHIWLYSCWQPWGVRDVCSSLHWGGQLLWLLRTLLLKRWPKRVAAHCLPWTHCVWPNLWIQSWDPGLARLRVVTSPRLVPVWAVFNVFDDFLDACKEREQLLCRILRRLDRRRRDRVSTSKAYASLLSSQLQAICILRVDFQLHFVEIILFIEFHYLGIAFL